MNRFIALVFLISCSLSFALEWCDNLDSYMNRGYSKEKVLSALEVDRRNHFENECISEGGEGSRFGYSGKWVSECGGSADAENGFLKSNVTCDFCSGSPITLELELTENDCREDCKESNLTCLHPSFPNQWGGEVVKKNPNGSVCGTTLPGCAESSSSSEKSSSSSAQSSSSEVASSSSQEESSDSGEESSSSDDEYCEGDDCESEAEASSSSESLCPCTDEDGPCFDDSGICSENSSSSEENAFSSNSNLIACYTPDDNGGCKFKDYVSKVKPLMSTDAELSENDIIYCDYRKGLISVGYMAELATARYVDEPDNPWLGCRYDENDCGSYLSPMLEHPFYTCYSGDMDENGCSAKNFTAVYFNKNLEFTESTLDRIPPNFTLDSAIALGDRAVQKISKMFVIIDGEYVGRGNLSSLTRRTMADALSFCNYIINDYEWRHRSSSSAQLESSSSSEESSSSAVESSSSSEDASSSSEERMSSSEIFFSSSSESFVEPSSSSGAETFVSGGNQTYTPDQIFNDGLQNMESGKCYSLNSERGSVVGWSISLNAQDTWWWREVDCETGDTPLEEGVGSCAAFPGKKPSDVSACYAYNGSCYICDNSESFVDCNADWLWNYNFPYHNWFKQVNCNDPYEEEDESCIEEDVIALKKTSVTTDWDNNSFEGDYKIDFMDLSIKYDALGKVYKEKTMKKNHFRTIYTRELSKTRKFNQVSNEKSFYIHLNIRVLRKDGVDPCDKPCGELGQDYGIRGVDGGNDFGVYCGCPYQNYSLNKVKVVQRKNGSCGYKNPNYKVTLTIPLDLSVKRDDYFVVPSGYKFSDDLHVATDDERDCIFRHEKGHKRFAECWKNGAKKEVKIEMELCKSEFKCDLENYLVEMAKNKQGVLSQKIDPAFNNAKNDNVIRWQQICGWYHKEYTREDGPVNAYDVSCPSDKLLKNKYDLTGCELE